MQHLIPHFACFLNFLVLEKKKSDRGRVVLHRIGWRMTARPHSKWMGRGEIVPHRSSGYATDAEQRRPETAEEVIAAPPSPPEEAAKSEED